jgi:NAD(P)-dependent dehydrogenase (short-subunit alcohol dehydrogenase family)
MRGLDGKTALVAGGAGEVGEGIVKALLHDGATVIVPSRRAAALDGLRERLGESAGERLATHEANVGTIEGAERLRDVILEQFGRLDVVVASIGHWWQGAPLTGVPFEDWKTVIDDNLTSHFVVARTFLPLLASRSGSSYVFINGDACRVPVPKSGPVSITAAAQLMMKDVVAAELKGRPVRVNSIVIGTPVVTRSRSKVKPEWLTADEVGRYVAYLVSDAASGVNGESINLNDRAQVEEIAER